MLPPRLNIRLTRFLSATWTKFAKAPSNMNWIVPYWTTSVIRGSAARITSRSRRIAADSRCEDRSTSHVSTAGSFFTALSFRMRPRLSRSREAPLHAHARLISVPAWRARDPQLHAVADRAAEHDPGRVRVRAARRKRRLTTAIGTRAPHGGEVVAEDLHEHAGHCVAVE